MGSTCSYSVKVLLPDVCVSLCSVDGDVCATYFCHGSLLQASLLTLYSSRNALCSTYVATFLHSKGEMHLGRRVQTLLKRIACFLELPMTNCYLLSLLQCCSMVCAVHLTAS